MRNNLKHYLQAIIVFLLLIVASVICELIENGI